jgi:DNA-binding beta-propeller fold protein YncE
MTAGLDGNFYLVEAGGHKVRKIDATGAITTVAGTGVAGTAVNSLDRPRGVAVDAAGTLYITDANNHRVVMVRNGTSSVLAGGSEGLALNELKLPQGITIGPDGYLYVADSGNHRIMRY